MAKVELTTEMVVGNVTFVKNDTYALRQHQLMPNLKELVCVYDIITNELTIGRIMLLKVQPAPNAPFIGIDIYLDNGRGNNLCYVSSFDNVVFPNLLVTPSILNNLFHKTAEFIEQYGYDEKHKAHYRIPFDQLPIYVRELNTILPNPKDSYLTIFRTPFHVVIEDAGFAKNGGHVDFRIVSQIFRHITTGSVFVSYEKDCIRIIPLSLGGIEANSLSEESKHFINTLFRPYVIDGPTFETYKDVSVSAKTLIQLYALFFEATYITQYGVLDRLCSPTKQTVEQDAPTVLRITDPSYINELYNRVEVLNPFKENHYENLPTE